MLFTPQTNYDKLIIFVLTMIVALGSAMAGQDLGLTAVQSHWISVIVGVAGTLLAYVQQNKNQPTLPPNHVVVAATDVVPGAKIVAQAK